MMGLRDKQAGQCSKIGCDRARELFYDLAACQLSGEEALALSLHEASCPACGAEFNEWRTLQSALLNSRVVPAADFRAGVMARVLEVRAASRPARRVLWQQGWMKAAAAAAVVVALIAGTSKLPATTGLVSLLDGRTPITTPAPTPAPPPAPIIGENPAPGTDSPGTAPAVPDTGEPAAPEQPGTPTDQGETDQERPSVPPTTSEGPQIADPDKNRGVFLSNQKGMITTTTIKVRVDSIEQASGKALGIADSSGASLRGEPWEQSSNVFFNFDIDPGRADAFLDRLRSLGSVLGEPYSDSKDVTGEYTSTLEAYNKLRAQQSAAAESDKAQYDSQIAPLESQLKGWDDGKRVVVLWLSW